MHRRRLQPKIKRWEYLSLYIVTSHNISYGPQGGCLYWWIFVPRSDQKSGYCKRAISLGRADESTIPLILSLTPSDKYENDQQASVSISSSFAWSSITSKDKLGATWSQAGDGFPRHKLLNVHVALRIREILGFVELTSEWRTVKSGLIISDCNK